MFNIRVCFTLLMACTFALVCGRVQAQTNQTQLVYERAFTAIFREDVDVRRPPTVHVFQSSASVKWLSDYSWEPDSASRSRAADSSGRRVLWGELPLQLRDALLKMLSQPTTIPTQALPRGVSSRDDRDSSGIVLSVSPVACNADSTEALVYVGVHCGAVCGCADILYLRQGRPYWAIQANFPF